MRKRFQLAPFLSQIFTVTFIFQFADDDFHPGSPGYIHNPLMENKIHCVAIVMDGSLIGRHDCEMIRNIRSLKKALDSRSM
jgi:hypothetical protein